MFQKIVFSVLCAFLVPPILMPGDTDDFAEASVTCPSGSKANDEVETETPLERRIYSQTRKAQRFEKNMALDDIYIRMDAESLYCYERDEQVVLEAFMTLWWHDRYICWNPADFDNVNNVSIRNADLWMPKLISYTKSIETYEPMHQISDCVVYANGTVSCRTIIFVNGLCKMFLKNWPMASHANCWISLDIFNPTGRQKLLHRDDRTEWEWLESANMGNPGQFIATGLERETEGNGVVYRFHFTGTTSAFAHALTTVAVVLSLVIVASFGLPAGSPARMSLLGCACVSFLLSIGFLGSQLSSVTPDTPVFVKLHGDILIIAGIALLPATLLAPRLVPTKPYPWQLRCRSWLLSSSIGRFLLRIFRVSNPSEEIAPLGEDGQQSTAFQKDDSGTSDRQEDPTRALLFTLTDRIIAAICFISLLGVWCAMIFGSSEDLSTLYFTVLGRILLREDIV